MAQGLEDLRGNVHVAQYFEEIALYYMTENSRKGKGKPYTVLKILHLLIISGLCHVRLLDSLSNISYR
jgi:hypothetical protein